MKQKFILPITLIATILSGCGSVNSSAPSDSIQDTESTEVASPQSENYVYQEKMDLSFSFGDRSGIYTGEINSTGLPDGVGSYSSVNSNGRKWVYYGKWINGHFDGIGTTEFEDGSYYTGLYENDVAHGTGIYNDGNGYWECGNFDNDSDTQCYYYQDSSDSSAIDLNIDQSLSLDIWDIQVNDVQIKSTISDSKIYYDSPEGCKYVAINISVTNNSTHSVTFFPDELYADDIYANLTCSGKNEFVPTRFDDYSYDILSTVVNPTTTDSGEIIFEIPDSIIEANGEMVLNFTVGSDTKSVKIR